MMARTLSPITPSQIQNLMKQGLKNGAACGEIVAEPLERPVASMAAHCSRTAYVFPPGPGPQQDELFESLTGTAKGNSGISGPEGKPQILKNNGSCGHMYMHMDKGGPNKCGSLLIGFESDSPLTTNQMGHTRDLRATPESMSSFLGQRSDEMGIKYGGRIVDCTKVPMDEFSSHYRSMLVEGMKNPPLPKNLPAKKITGSSKKEGTASSRQYLHTYVNY